VRIGIKLDIFDLPLVLSLTFSITEMALSVNDILIKVRFKVVEGIFSNIVPFSLGSLCSKYPIVSEVSFGLGN